MKKALEGTDIGAINAAADELNTYVQKIGEEIQKQGGAQGAPGGAPPNMGGEKQEEKKPDIEEAEVEILDDEDKS